MTSFSSLLLFVVLVVIQQASSSTFTALFNITYSSHCIGVYPLTVEIAVRHKSPTSFVFSQWSLVYYMLEGCNSEWHSVTTEVPTDEETTGIEIQYMLKASICDCVIIGDNVLLSGNSITNYTINTSQLLCDPNFPNCDLNQNKKTSAATVTKVVNISGSTLHFETECNYDKSVGYVVLEGTNNVCPTNKSQYLPLKPITLPTNEITVKLIFSMALKYDGCNHSCCDIEFANHGILLLSAIIRGINIPIHFYTPTANISNGNTNINIEEIGSSYRLYFNGRSQYTIPFNLSMSDTSVVHTVNIQYSYRRDLHNRMRLRWLQREPNDMQGCNVWELGDVNTYLIYNEHTRKIYTTNLQSFKNWGITNGVIQPCQVDINQDCLLFNKTDSTGNRNTRRAVSPLFNLQYASPVVLQPFCSNALSCDSDEYIVTITFTLKLTQFIQPIIGTDSSPNAILLSLQTQSNTKPLIYFAPFANYYWPQFNITSRTLYGVYIRSPSCPTNVIQGRICIKNNTSSFILSWKQDNYTVSSDVWSLSQKVNVTVQNLLSSSQQIPHSQSWLYTNGTLESITDNEMIFSNGNGSSPRIAQLSVNIESTTSTTSSSVSSSFSTKIFPTSFSTEIFTSSTSVQMYSSSTASTYSSTTASTYSSSTPASTYSSSTPASTYSSSTPASTYITTIITTVFPTSTPDSIIGCQSKDGWPYTKAGQNATGTFCFDGTVNGTRHCNIDGAWEISHCQASNSFNKVLKANDTQTALELLVTSEELTSAQMIYLFALVINSDTIEQEQHQLSNNYTDELVKTFVSNIINDFSTVNNNTVRRKLGSQLLSILDTYALNSLEANVTISSDKFLLTTQEIRHIAKQQIEGISFNENSITLPVEIFDLQSLPIRIASFVYHNLSSVLTPHNSSLRLASSIVSSITDCTNCTLNNLNESVVISFNLSNLQVSRNDDDFRCVYWEFERSNDNTLPTGGDWRIDGCQLIGINRSIATCICNHLTHFAILLSPGAMIDPIHYKILTIAGYILVPISLICMLLTILVYTCMKELWNMRNYIHVMLCINLFIAQLLFVVGVERTENKYVCSIIAVVLQYMFLVSFMWMLMEGVVLYVTLVRVFIKHTKRYILGFTLFSYGAPFLYMIVVVPIGYLVNTSNDTFTQYLFYNDDNELTACWLSYANGFIWSFIVPVILTVLANIGFLIMAIVIMKKHFKKQPSKNHLNKFKYWLKCSISLIIVMGIAWIANVVFFRKELVFVAYIMTIFIAGQGIVIFVLYVPLSKHVREAYFRWWQKKRANSQLLSTISEKLSVSLFSSVYVVDQKVKNDTHSKSEKNIYCELSLVTENNKTKDNNELDTKMN